MLLDHIYMTSMSEFQISVIPDELWVMIFNSLDISSIAKMKRVCRAWKALIESDFSLKKKLPKIYGSMIWKKHIGDVGAVPRLPKNILQALSEQDPNNPDITVCDSFYCVLIPEFVGKTQLTVPYFLESAKTKCSELLPARPINDEYPRPSKSYWALVCTELYTPSINRSAVFQHAEIRKLPPANSYDFPYLREITFTYVLSCLEQTSSTCSKKEKVNRLKTRCKETLESPKTGFHRIFGTDIDQRITLGFAPGNRLHNIGVCLVRRQREDII